MCDGKQSARISEIERRILRVLCQCEYVDRGRESLLLELKNYRWHEPEHQVVYEALEGMRELNGRLLREYLPAHAVRMGFPEINWANYFDAPESAAAELPELLSELKAALSER